MAGEHYRYIQDQIDLAASRSRKDESGADMEVRAGVINEICAMLIDYKDNAPEVTQYLQSRVEVKDVYDRELERYVVRIRLLYGGKLSLSPEERALVVNNAYQSTGDTSLPSKSLNTTIIEHHL